MRVALVADIHGCWAEAAAFAQRHRCEAILVAGDLGEAAYSAPWPVPVYWVWGDDNSRLVWRDLTRRGLVPHCHLIQNWTTVTIGGLVVLGAGAERDNAMLPGPAVVLPPVDKVPTADVIVSHAAGWHRHVASGSRTYDIYDNQIARAIHESGARLAVSGHRHQWLRGRTGGGRTRCYGLGNHPVAWALLDTRTQRVSRPEM